MLIRTKSMKLHTGMGLSCGAEGFSSRIQGNYGLLGSAPEPKDLLFLMTEPPEEAPSPAGMTVLVDQSGRQDHWSVTMEVLNHVVNRILLDGSPSFTYQDQVYITTVLNRLGIADTERFMSQVRQLRAESESTVHLLALYERELSRIREARESGTPLPPLPAPPEEGQEHVSPASDVELSLAILRRLDALENIQRLYDLRRSFSLPENRLQPGALQFSEQLRLLGSVSLEEHKRQLFQAPRLSLLYRLNRYEAGAEEDGGGRGGAPALSQAAAAVLSGAVDNVYVQLLHRPELFESQWLHLEQALRQSGAGSLARYILYHESPPPAAPAALSLTEETVWNRYAGEVRSFRALRQYLDSREERAVPPSSLPGRAETALRLLFPREPDSLPVDIRPLPGTGTLLREALRERDLLERDRVRTERVLEAERRLPSPPGTAAPPLELHHSTERTELRESRWLHPEQDLRQSGASAPARDTPGRESPPPAAPAAPSLTEETVWNRYAGEARSSQELRQYLVSQEEGAAPAPSLPGRAETALRLLLPQEADSPPVDVRPLPGTDTLRREALRERDSLERDHVRTERILEEERRLPSPTETAAPPLALYHSAERTETVDALRERTAEKTAERTAFRERLERTLREQRIWPPAASAESRTLRLERELLRQSLHTAETARQEVRFQDSVPAREREIWTASLTERHLPGDIPPLTLTARQAEELAPELLEEAVRRIDQRSRTLQRILTPREEPSAPAPLPAPDLQRTLRESLRALSEPEALQRELAERRQAEASAPLALTHREELLLRQLPAEERRIFETVLAYEKDPERALSQGILRPGSLGELQSAIRQAERPAAERIHPASEEDVSLTSLLERADTIREQLPGLTRRGAEEGAASAPPPAPRLLRTPPPEEAGGETRTERIHPVSEEDVSLTRLLERVDTIREQLPGLTRRGAKEGAAPAAPPVLRLLHKAPPEEDGEETRTERHQTRTTVRTEEHREEVRRREERQVDVTRQERTLVSETAEDITALVNRTLAEQMRTISDQVYRQMEKRLQLERSRRGRL